MKRDIHIVSTGVANLASVIAMVERHGATAVPTANPKVVRRAEWLVVPGVGSFAAGVRAIDAAGLRQPLVDRIGAGAPTFGICLGLQLLGRSSEESPGVEGLGVIDAPVRRMSSERLPQIGWNGTEGSLAGDYYFVNSFAFERVPGDWSVTWYDYSRRYVAAVRRGNVVATQFHPELSGDRGQLVFAAWLDGTKLPDVQRRSLERVSTRVIPCLDIRDGRVVKGVQFKGLRDAGDPVACAARYASEGADEVTILDVSATVEGRRAALDVVRAVRRECAIPLTVGGGVRSVEDAAVYLEAGADKVAVNSAAVRNPALVTSLAGEFGSQCIVASLDARWEDGRWVTMVAGGRTNTGIDAVVLAAELAERGAGELLLTSFDRDGTGTGYDEELIAAVRERISIPVIASGGGRTAEQMKRAIAAGADALLAATIFHDGETTVDALKRELTKAGLEVRS